MNKYVWFFIGLLWSIQNLQANACPDPTVWMEGLNEKVIQAITKNTTNKDKAKIIQSIFQPSLDVELFTKKIIGRAYWMDASPSDREALKKNIFNVMLHEYTQIIVETLARKPQVYRVRTTDDGKTMVTVLYRTQRDKNLLAIFSLTCYDTKWKIYDISVQGVRLSDLQQAKYNKVLSTSGISGLNSILEDQAQDKE